MTLLAPLTVPVEKYVVVDIVNGVAQTAELHLPAAERVYNTYNGVRNQRVRFTDRIQTGFPPSSWPAACGAFLAGWIYVEAGPLAGRPFCPRCVAAAAPRVVPEGRAQRAVLELLADGAQTIATVAARRGTTQQAAGQTLLKLIERGLVARCDGVYSLRAVAEDEAA